ncbi:MAG TPA: hypothetical protein VD932_06025 [Aquabacterium sp.]|nr:hypothetical protein [Aquabacterium sp.]
MLNRKLGWALAVTLALTAVALLTGRDATVHGEAVDGRPSDRMAAFRGTGAASGVSASLPDQVERQIFSVPDRDPFSPPTPPPAPAPAPAAPTVQAPPPPPPPAPPPPFTARYVAQLLTPAGERLLYFRDGEQLTVVQQGTALWGGYVVEALIRADAKTSASVPAGSASTAVGSDVIAVEVVHPLTNHRQTVPIPPLHRDR